MPSSGGPIRCRTRRTTSSSTACAAAAITSAPIWPGGSTTTAGGARARSSSSWTATASSRPSAAPAPRTISAAPTISTSAAVDPQFPRAYVEFTTPYAGLPQVIRPDGLYRSQQRFGLYRWHIMDPIRFEQRSQGHHPGARLAHRKAGPPLPAAPGRHRLGRVLVPVSADRALPGPAGPGLLRGHLRRQRAAAA